MEITPRVRSRAPAADDTTPPVTATETVASRPEDLLTKGEIGAVMAKVAKLHGPNVIRSAELRPRYRHTPTNIFTLDLSMFGGFIEGGATLVYGRSGGGKSTLTGRVIGQAQRKYPDKAAVLIDLEGTYQPEWGGFHGVDNSSLVLVQPDTGEQALDLALSLISAEETSVIAIDSLAALLPTKELEKSMEDLTVGEQGRLISRFCRVMQGRLNAESKRGHRPVVIWTNQWRNKIGVMYGDPRVLPGGDAQHYYAVSKVEIKNKEETGKGQDGIGTVLVNQHSFVIAKSKVGTGIREGEFEMIRDPQNPMGQGFIDDAKSVIAWSRSMGHITGGGSSWRVKELDMKFGRLQEIADYMYSDDAWYANLKDFLIREYRERCGLRPDYLT